MIDEIKGKTIFIDTAPLIYYIEGSSKYQKILNKLFDLNVKKHFELITSTLTLVEVLVQPMRLSNYKLVDMFETILTNSETLTIIDLNINISRKAAEIRAKYNFKTPDSIQLATAIENSADYFLTNDKKLVITEIESIILGDIGTLV